MSAIVNKIMKIYVTDGDAVSTNRVSGKSNTGTYFICSLKNFDKYEMFFKETNEIHVDLKRILQYKISFKELFLERKNDFPGKMRDFDEICDSLLSLQNNPTISIGLRKNDQRVFMRFLDNSGFVEMSLRNIIYSKLTMIVIEQTDNGYYLYLEPNLDEIELDKYKMLDAIVG